MIYYQKTMVAINKPEDKSFYWHFLDDGIRSKKEDKHSDKEYVWSDEKLEDFKYEIDDIDAFLENVRKGKFKYFRIEKGLFNKRERLVFDNDWNKYESWYVEDIKRVDAWFSYTKTNMTMSEAERALDVEEYAKMIKSLGLNNLKVRPPIRRG